MKPTQKELCRFAHSVKTKFPSVLSAVTKTLIAFALLLTISGCATKKQTWQDWMSVRRVAPTNREAQVIPPIPVLPTNGNALVFAPDYNIRDGAHTGPGFDLAMRNPDFPQTYIEAVHIDLSHPATGVHIQWAGPKASDAPTGPWNHTPGRGGKGMNCDDVEESNIVDSRCTPKGVFPVVGFADHLKHTPTCLYATWVLYTPRYIAIHSPIHHSHTKLPKVPVTAGCLRMPYETAKLIHNNSLVGVTLVNIYGTWQQPVTFKTHRAAHNQKKPPHAQ